MNSVVRQSRFPRLPIARFEAAHQPIRFHAPSAHDALAKSPIAPGPEPSDRSPLVAPVVLDVRSLTVHYRDRPALVDLSLQAQAGERIGIIGPNGAGKSTLLKALLGLVPTTAGQVRWFGQPIARQRSRLAYVPQRSQVDWHYPMTVASAVMTGQTVRLGWGRSPDRSARARAAEAMARLEIETLADRPLSQLSGGQQQRVFLARALTQNADIFLFDEPLAGVDRRTELLLETILDDLKRQAKLVLVCNHEWGQKLDRYDRLLLINGGLIAAGPPAMVLTPDHLTAAYGETLTIGSGPGWIDRSATSYDDRPGDRSIDDSLAC